MKGAVFFTATSGEYDFCEYELDLIGSGLSNPESAIEKYEILFRHWDEARINRGCSSIGATIRYWKEGRRHVRKYARKEAVNTQAS